VAEDNQSVSPLRAGVIRKGHDFLDQRVVESQAHRAKGQSGI
jgi:hypothetical protein